MLGLLEQFEAHDGSPVVAVTVLWVKVAQNAEAVAALDLMKLAHLLESALRQPSATTGNKPRTSWYLISAECMTGLCRGKMMIFSRVVFSNGHDRLSGMGKHSNLSYSERR
jgi:hypothetical protein